MHGNALVMQVGELLYALGFSAEYAFVKTGRNLRWAGVAFARRCKELFVGIAAMAFPGAAQVLGDIF